MAGAKVRSISTILVRTEQLQLQCSVQLFNRDDELAPINFFKKNTSSIYMTSNPSVSLKLKHVDKNREYDKSSIITITEQSIFGIRTLLQAFHERFQREDLFGYDEHGRAVELNLQEGDILTYSVDERQTLRISPIIYQVPTKVLNEFMETRPGIGININFEQNLAILTIDEFEVLKSVLDQFDFLHYGHMLLLEYLMFAKNVTEAPVTKSPPVSSQGIRLFAPPDPEKSKETTSAAPFMRSNQNPTLDEL